MSIYIFYGREYLHKYKGILKVTLVLQILL